MPVKLVEEKDLKRIQRSSPLLETVEWKEIAETLQGKEKLPQGKALRITLSDSTISVLNKKRLTPDKAKEHALISFRQKLRITFPHFRVRVVGDEIAMLNKKDK